MSFAALDHVALVEDDASFRDALAERLELAGLKVATYASAEAALKGGGAGFGGVVVTDLRMPGMDGRTVATRIAANPRTAGIPIVLLTSVNQADAARAVAELGIMAQLNKPARASQLLETIVSAMQRARAA